MSLVVTIKKKSSWEFDTFGSGGVSVGYVAANGGTVRLKDPQGIIHSFYYGGIGAGISAGLKLPKIGKVQVRTKKGPLTGSIGPAPFPSKGSLFITNDFSGDELEKSNLRGLCAFVDIGAGIIVGYSGVALLLNLSPWWLSGIPATIPLLLGSADAVLLMRGPNVGIQAQIGGAAFLGALV